MKYSLVILLFVLIGGNLRAQSPVQEGPVEVITASKTDLWLEELERRLLADTSRSEAEIDSLLSRLDTVLNGLERPSGIYGHDIFKSDSLRVLAPGQINRVPDTYVLGPGDVLLISIFGISDLEVQLEVNDQGYVKPEQSSKIYVKGLTLGEVKQKIYRRFSQFNRFRRDQFSVALINPRSSTVNVLGEVNQPGSFRLEATNTVFNALVAANGINPLGTVRNIKVFSDEGVRSFDLYQYLGGELSKYDLYLQDNAIVQVPMAKKLVNVEGAVARPMTYELKDNEGLSAVLDYAGGLNGNAVKEFIQIERYVDDQLQLLDIPYNVGHLGHVPLENGDKVIVKVSESVYRNVVSAEGALAQPGTYALSNTKRVSDLITKAKLLPSAEVKEAFVLRMNADSTVTPINISIQSILESASSADNIELQESDKLVVIDQSAQVDKALVTVKGAVRAESEFNIDPRSETTLSQLLLMSGGATEDAGEEVYIIRSNPKNLTEKTYLKAALAEADQFVIQPWDEINVLSATKSSNLRYLKVRGAVRKPTKLPYAANATLGDLLMLSGGLLPEASSTILVYRSLPQQDTKNQTEEIVVQIDGDMNVTSPAAFQLQPDDEVVVTSVPEYEERAFVRLEGEVVLPGDRSLIRDGETLSSLVARAGGLTAEAFAEGAYILRDYMIITDSLDRNPVAKVAIRLDLALSNPGGINDVPLQEGDILMIPKLEKVVYLHLSNTRASETGENLVIGAAYNGSEDAMWYIEKYTGGLIDKGSRPTITVVQPNGAVEATTKKLFGYKYPKPERGATIYVGAQIDQEKKESVASTNKGVIVNVGTDADKVDTKEEEN